MIVEVNLLDGSPLQIEISSKSSGEDLIEAISKSINILEKDYFGVTHYDKKDQARIWVQNDRKLNKQMKEPMKCWFQVRFYPPDPAQLSEDITRYQLCLQIQQDVKSGKLPCSFVTHALLGAYLVQSELGDYDPVDHGLSTDYIRDFDFAPNQSEDLLERIMEVHKTLKGQSPAEAELHYLDNAKKLAMYGVSLHPARDSEGVDIMLGVCSSGILVYRDRLRINRFAWPKIIKISYKRNGFYIKIRPGEFEHFESTVGFKLENHKAAKRLWKICVEHHSFFRLLSPDTKEKPKFPRFGSRFRYSGRTQHQAKKNISMADRTNPAFDRSGSHGRGNNTANLSSQSMQGISRGGSPRGNTSPTANDLENPANKRHTLAHPLPDEVHKELEEAQNKRNLKNNDGANIPRNFDMSQSYPQDSVNGTPRNMHNDIKVPKPAFTEQKPVVPQPRARTPPMSDMDRSFSNTTSPMIPNGHTLPSTSPLNSVPTYSPAYQNHSGPFAGRQSPAASFPARIEQYPARIEDRKSPAMNLRNSEYDDPSVDYVASATKHSGAASPLQRQNNVEPIGEIIDVDDAIGQNDNDGIVDIDDVLDRDPESTFQFSTTTTENLTQSDNKIIRETEQTFQNLNTGETNMNELTSIRSAVGNPSDHVKAKSVTTRSGTYHEDKETGASHSLMESQTTAATSMTTKDGTQTDQYASVMQKKTSRKESTTNSSFNSSSSSSAAVTNMDAISENMRNGKDVKDVIEEHNAEGTIVSSQTITSKTRTVETTTYAIEQEGATETHIEQKVTIQSDGDPVDHDEALAQAIQEATAMNPDFTVEKIEINQTTQDD